MTARKGFLGVGVFLLVCTLCSFAYGQVQTVEGTVVEVNHLRKTFSICPVDAGCGITEENVFVVTSTTKTERMDNIWQLRTGDRVEVTGEPLNEIVWKTHEVKRLH